MTRTILDLVHEARAEFRRKYKVMTVFADGHAVTRAEPTRVYLSSRTLQQLMLESGLFLQHALANGGEPLGMRVLLASEAHPQVLPFPYVHVTGD